MKRANAMMVAALALASMGPDASAGGEAEPMPFIPPPRPVRGFPPPLRRMPKSADEKRRGIGRKAARRRF